MCGRSRRFHTACCPPTSWITPLYAVTLLYFHESPVRHRESVFNCKFVSANKVFSARTVTAERVRSLRKRPRRVIVVVENRVERAASRRVAEQMRIFRARLDQRHREVPRPGPVRRATDPNAHLPAAGAGVLLPRQQDGRTVWEDD